MGENEEQLHALQQGVEAWNRWREDNPKLRVYFPGADFIMKNFTGANFRDMHSYEPHDFDGSRFFRGYLRVMFAVDDIDETLERLRKRGAQLAGEVVQYKDAYRLCYIRGHEGLLIGLAQELS
jgi:catechol 2,3-dioxygenase-like lactoylglutathione lyase family enzyme